MRREQKLRVGKRDRKVDARRFQMNESASEAVGVTGRSKQAASNRPEEWVWIDRSIWTDRMLAALGNGVRGGKWFSLIDKVYRRSTLRTAWSAAATPTTRDG
jgi:hypothetical protein